MVLRDGKKNSESKNIIFTKETKDTADSDETPNCVTRVEDKNDTADANSREDSLHVSSDKPLLLPDAPVSTGFVSNDSELPRTSI